MSYEIFRHKDFDVSIKRLAKRYRSMADDYEDFLKSLEKNPFQGTELCPGIRKIRMSIASKGRIVLLTIYDKEDASTVRLNVIKQMACELGFSV